MHSTKGNVCWSLYIWPHLEEGHFQVTVKTCGWHGPGLGWAQTPLTSPSKRKEGETNRHSGGPGRIEVNDVYIMF